MEDRDRGVGASETARLLGGADVPATLDVASAGPLHAAEDAGDVGKTARRGWLVASVATEVRLAGTLQRSRLQIWVIVAMTCCVWAR